MRIGVVYLKPRKVAYVRRTGPYSVSSLEAWRDMLAWVDKAGLRRMLTCSYGLALDPPASVALDQCRYDACIEIPEGFSHLSTFGLSHQTLPGGAFARMRHVGRYDQVRSTIHTLRDTWLPTQQHLRLDHRRPLLVIYLDDPKQRAAEALRCDVCVPVRACHEASVESDSATARAANDMH